MTHHSARLGLGDALLQIASLGIPLVTCFGKFASVITQGRAHTPPHPFHHTTHKHTHTHTKVDQLHACSKNSSIFMANLNVEETVS